MPHITLKQSKTNKMNPKKGDTLIVTKIVGMVPWQIFDELVFDSCIGKDQTGIEIYTVRYDGMIFSISSENCKIKVTTELREGELAVVVGQNENNDNWGPHNYSVNTIVFLASNNKKGFKVYSYGSPEYQLVHNSALRPIKKGDFIKDRATGIEYVFTRKGEEGDKIVLLDENKNEITGLIRDYEYSELIMEEQEQWGEGWD